MSASSDSEREKAYRHTPYGPDDVRNDALSDSTDSMPDKTDPDRLLVAKAMQWIAEDLSGRGLEWEDLQKEAQQSWLDKASQFLTDHKTS